MRPIRRALHTASRLLPAGRRAGLLVLTYHLVGAGTRSPVDLDPGLFRAQLEELRALAVPVDLRTALRALGEPDPGGPPRVLVTFDDAYANFHERAWPVLEALSIPSVLYVPTGFVEGRTTAPIRGTAHLPAASWTQLAELAGSGLVAIGSHTCSHRDLPALPPEELVAEVKGSRALLEDRLGVAVDSFCYPRGASCPGAEPLVEATYRSAVVRGGRRNRCGVGWSPWRLERVPLRRDMPASLAPILESRVWMEEWAVTRLLAWRASVSIVS